jgi:hypothetical protein
LRHEATFRFCARGLWLVDRFEFAAVDGEAGFGQRAHLAAEFDELRANLFDRRATVFAEVGDGFVIRREPLPSTNPAIRAPNDSVGQF